MKMENKYIPGYEVMSKSCPMLGSAGDISTNSAYLLENNFPDYAIMSYALSQFEVLADLRYSRLDIGYDSGLREIKNDLNGKPIELYTSNHDSVPAGIGKEDSNKLIPVPMTAKDSIIDEIEKARKKILNKQLVMKEVEEVITIRRKVKEVVLRESRKDF